MFIECSLVDYMRGTEPPSSSVEWPQAVVLSVFSCHCIHLRRNRSQTWGKEGFTQGQVESISSKAKARMH